MTDDEWCDYAEERDVTIAELAQLRAVQGDSGERRLPARWFWPPRQNDLRTGKVREGGPPSPAGWQPALPRRCISKHQLRFTAAALDAADWNRFEKPLRSAGIRFGHNNRH